MSKIEITPLYWKIYSTIFLRELGTITIDYATENIFYTDGSMIDDLDTFAVHNGVYNHLPCPFGRDLCD
jgi:hypothetical protein